MLAPLHVIDRRERDENHVQYRGTDPERLMPWVVSVSAKPSPAPKSAINKARVDSLRIGRLPAIKKPNADINKKTYVFRIAPCTMIVYRSL